MVSFLVSIVVLVLLLFGWRGFRAVAIIGLLLLGFLGLAIYGMNKQMQEKEASDPLSPGMINKAAEADSKQNGANANARTPPSPTIGDKAEATYEAAIAKRKLEIQQRIVALRASFPPLPPATTPQELMQQHIEQERRTQLENKMIEDQEPIYPDFTPAELEYRWQQYTDGYWDSRLHRYCGPGPSRSQIAKGKNGC